MRVYEIARDYQPTEIDTGEAASRFLGWLAGQDASALLAHAIGLWLVLPPDAGGLGALAESEADVAALQAEISALCRRAQHLPGLDGTAGR